MDYTTFKNCLFDIEQWLKKAEDLRIARYAQTGPWEMTQEDLIKMLDGYEAAQASLGTIGNFIYQAKKKLK